PLKRQQSVVADISEQALNVIESFGSLPIPPLVLLGTLVRLRRHLQRDFIFPFVVGFARLVQIFVITAHQTLLTPTRRRQYPMRKSVRRPVGVSHSTRSPSTWAIGGPALSNSTNASTARRSPSTSTSTRPSSSL